MYRLFGYLNETAFQKQRMFVQVFESWIPFVPQMLIVYCSYFLMMVLPLFLLQEKKSDEFFLKRMFFVSLIGQIAFVAIPTSVQRYTNFAAGDTWHDLMQLVYSLDYNNNCFPTLHAAHAFVISHWLFTRSKNYLFLVWGAAIALSTVLVYQHHWVDVLGALVLVTAVSLKYSVPQVELEVEVST